MSLWDVLEGTRAFSLRNAPQRCGRELGKPYLKVFPERISVNMKIRKLIRNTFLLTKSPGRALQEPWKRSGRDLEEPWKSSGRTGFTQFPWPLPRPWEFGRDVVREEGLPNFHGRYRGHGNLGDMLPVKRVYQISMAAAAAMEI